MFLLPFFAVVYMLAIHQDLISSVWVAKTRQQIKVNQIPIAILLISKQKSSTI